MHSQYLRDNIRFESTPTLVTMTSKTRTRKIQETHPQNKHKVKKITKCDHLQTDYSVSKRQDKLPLVGQVEVARKPIPLLADTHVDRFAV